MPWINDRVTLSGLEVGNGKNEQDGFFKQIRGFQRKLKSKGPHPVLMVD